MRRFLMASAAVSITLGLSACGAKPIDPTTTDAYKALQTQLNTAKKQLTAAQAQIADDDKLLANLRSLTSQVASAKARTAAQARSAKSANARAQTLLKQIQREQGLIVQSTVGGGTHWVGHDMRPGTYRSAGNYECYWQISSDPNGQNIVANDNVNGAAFVSVSAGQYFESERCSKWVPIS